MNSTTYARRAAAAVAWLCVWVAAPAWAEGACELVDADLGTESTGGSTATALSAIACGDLNTASGMFGTAVGNNNVASGESASAFGRVNSAQGAESSAVGYGNLAIGDRSVAVGVGNVAAGANSVAIGEVSQATGSVSIAIGSGARAENVGSIAIGPSSSAQGDNSVAIGGNANVSGENSVALGDSSSTDRHHVVAVGSQGGERQIVNVAAGTQATDAVNLSQMQAGDAQALAQSKAYTDSRMAGFDVRLERLGALNAAMVGMAASAAAVESGRTRVGVAAGSYGGKAALSVGVQRRFGSRMAMTLGGAFSGSERSGTIGVGFGF